MPATVVGRYADQGREFESLSRLVISKEENKMDVVIMTLGVLYLCGKNVGTALAICSMIEGALVFTSALLKKLKEKGVFDE